MTVNWFPGHMDSARKEAAKTMAKVDVVIEILDARLPGASSNPLIERLRLGRQRPCLKVLNKGIAHRVKGYLKRQPERKRTLRSSLSVARRGGPRLCGRFERWEPPSRVKP